MRLAIPSSAAHGLTALEGAGLLAGDDVDALVESTLEAPVGAHRPQAG